MGLRCGVVWCGHFAPKWVGVRGPKGEFSPQPEYPWGELSPQPEYQMFTKMTQREWLDMNIFQILPKGSGSKWKSNGQQEYVWAAHPYWLGQKEGLLLLSPTSVWFGIGKWCHIPSVDFIGTGAITIAPVPVQKHWISSTQNNLGYFVIKQLSTRC